MFNLHHLKVMVLIFGFLVVGVFSTNVYSQHNAKHGDKRKAPDFQTVYQYTIIYLHTKSCPNYNGTCSGTISGYSYKHVGHKEKRWVYQTYNENNNTWETTGYSEWTYHSTVTTPETSVYWDSYYDDDNCSYGFEYALMDKHLIRFLGDYHV